MNGARHGARAARICMAAVMLLGSGTSPGDTFEEAQASGDHATAIARAREHTQSEPERALGWYRLGLALAGTGKLDDARAAYERARERPGDGQLSAELELARLDYRRGERSRAIAGFERVVDYYRGRRAGSPAEVTAAATAAEYLGRTRPMMFQGAVQLYNEAMNLERMRRDTGASEARIRLGYLLLDKYNNTEAREVLDEVLSRHPTNARALLGLARSQHFDHSNEALATLGRALESNPNLVPAIVFGAELHIESERFVEAREALERAIEINPAALEAWSVLAAVHYLTDDEAAYAKAEASALALNPTYAQFYATVADLAANNRRYEDAVSLSEQAVALDPYSWRALGLLGTNQMRVGLMVEGRQNLEKAFGGDPYNVWIKNLLDLSDTFGEYVESTSGRFELMLHGEEAATLEPYLLPLAERTYDEFAKRYGIEPATPIRIEVYPRHADFSVRTVGLAGLGILGVSFGPVVAMDSPSARARGEFNWASTLRHELAHTFHLALTGNRVPRWFSEGLAVHEERRAGNGWGGDATADFLAAMAAGRLLPLSRLNDGFVRPSYPQQVIHAYYQSSLALEFIESRYGFSAVRGMLDAFNEGASTADAIGRVLETDVDSLDKAFSAHIAELLEAPLAAVSDAGPSKLAQGVSDPAMVYAAADTAPGDFNAQMRAGRLAFEESSYDKAQAYFEQAKTLFPQLAQGLSPYRMLARVHEASGRPEAAAGELAALIDINAEDYDAHIDLARLRRELGQPAMAADALLRGVWIFPFDLDVHRELAQIYGELDDWPAAARERRAVLALEPTDVAGARFELARAYFNAGELDSARYEILRTLEIAPEYEAAQDLLMDIRSASAPAAQSGANSSG